MPTEVSKETMMEIIREISKKMKKVSSVLKESNAAMGNKNISELVGKVAEGTFAEILTKKLGYEVKAAQSDNDPDLLFTKTGEKAEIKMASGDNGWQGGDLSKRPSDYFLITWGGNFDEFFVARAHIGDEEWHHHMPERYGTSYPAKDLYNKKEKIIYLGSLEKTPRGAIKIKREKVG